ncbi:MAG: hypothetical protein R3176_05870 [Woeseiaceae bacterium]|nr:hypothetical protein [Woeseiaceae bacterium]
MPAAFTDAARRPAPVRGFHVAVSLLIVSIVALGFWPSYFGLILGTGVEKELFIHVHAVVYVSWLALFVAQTVLVAMRRVDLHRKLGTFGIYYGFVVLAVGTVTAVLRFGTMNADGMGDVARQFVIWPLLDMVIFAAFFVPAVLYRRKPAMHKRLMIVATTNLIVAAVFRAVGLDDALAHTLFVLLWLSPILVAMLHDLVRERLVHPVYVVGALVLAVSSFRSGLTDTAPWVGFTEWMARVLA